MAIQTILQQKAGNELEFVTITNDGLSAPQISIQPTSETSDFNTLILQIVNMIDG